MTFKFIDSRYAASRVQVEVEDGELLAYANINPSRFLLIVSTRHTKSFPSKKTADVLRSVFVLEKAFGTYPIG
jgi:hypothetical protein